MLQGALDPTSWLQSTGPSQESNVSETTAIALCFDVLGDTTENEEESMEFDLAQFCVTDTQLLSKYFFIYLCLVTGCVQTC